jgi:2-iminoacetate synthase ThiH
MKDYYLDKNNKVVFTKEYHLKRGYCCNNNCKHCPYKKKSKKFGDIKK